MTPLPLRFHDRRSAGRELAGVLAAEFQGRQGVVVIALPRGGVPVAYEVARALHAPLDVHLVRKLGVPGQEELAFGALSSGGVMELDQERIELAGITPREVESVVARETRELERRERRYRAGRAPLEVRGRTAILVDDGLATGSSMRAAISALRRREPAEIVVAVPCGSSTTCAELEELAERVVCLSSPEPFHAVGQGYERFDQESDEEVVRLLEAARTEEQARVAGEECDPARTGSQEPASAGHPPAGLDPPGIEAVELGPVADRLRGARGGSG